MAWALFSGRTLLSGRSRLDTDLELRRALDNKILLLLLGCCPELLPELRSFSRHLTDPFHVERAEQVAMVLLGHTRDNQEEEEEEEEEEEQKKFFKALGKPWMVLKDKDGFGRSLARRFGVSEFPSLLVLDPNGSILSRNALPEIREVGASCFRAWREAAELLDRNFRPAEDFEGFTSRSLTEPLRRWKYRVREEEEEEEEEGEKKREEEEEEEEEE